MIVSSFQSPVPDPALGLHDRRSFGHVQPIRKMTPSRVSAPRQFSCFLRHRKCRYKSPPAHAGRFTPSPPSSPLLPRPARDLFRAPSGLQPVLDHRLALGSHLPRHGGCGPAPGRRLPLGGLTSIAPLPAVARRLPSHRGGVPFELAGDLAFRQTPMQPGVNLASFVMGQVVVAGRHEHSPLVANRDGLPSSGPSQPALHQAIMRLDPCCTLEWNGGIICWRNNDVNSSMNHLLQ